MSGLATGRFSTFQPSMGVAVAITVGKPKWPLRYELREEVRRLAPWGLLGLDDEAEFIRRYRERLDGLDLTALSNKFLNIEERHGGKRLVLLCYENVHAGEFCHRRVFAHWWLDRTGQDVPEVDDGPRQLRLGESPPACSTDEKDDHDGKDTGR